MNYRNRICILSDYERTRYCCCLHVDFLNFFSKHLRQKASVFDCFILSIQYKTLFLLTLTLRCRCFLHTISHYVGIHWIPAILSRTLHRTVLWCWTYQSLCFPFTILQWSGILHFGGDNHSHYILYGHHSMDLVFFDSFNDRQFELGKL